MEQWRYKVLVIREMALSEAKLNAEGEKGWELVSVAITDNTTARAFFKRIDDGTHPGDHHDEHLEEHAVEAGHALVTAP